MFGRARRFGLLANEKWRRGCARWLPNTHNSRRHIPIGYPILRLLAYNYYETIIVLLSYRILSTLFTSHRIVIVIVLRVRHACHRVHNFSIGGRVQVLLKKTSSPGRDAVPLALGALLNQ